MTQKDDLFPVVTYAEGAVSDDGGIVLCKVQTVAQSPLHFGIKREDLHDFVSFLLRLVANAGGASLPGRPVYQTIPVTAASVGELEDGNSCLGVTVGGRDLMFEIPSSALSEMGRLLMAASVAQPDRLV